jgi:L-serine dehydratase
MFISVLDLFKVGIGPSSSHTVGPMIAAERYRKRIANIAANHHSETRIKCVLKGSLAHTGKGHGTDKAVILGLHGYLPNQLISEDVDHLYQRLLWQRSLALPNEPLFAPQHDLIFDLENSYTQHPNGMEFSLFDEGGECLDQQVYFSIGGGFISTLEDISSLEAPIHFAAEEPYPFPFESAKKMMQMAGASGLSIADMKAANEDCLNQTSDTGIEAREVLHQALWLIWEAMRTCLERGLSCEGLLPGGLNVKRRAAHLCEQLKAADGKNAGDKNEWLCAYAMAVNEENAAGHMVVTAPTNGAAGVIPAVLYYYMQHEEGCDQDVYDFLLTAGAIGGLIKHRSSISGAEVGCQGEVGSAAAMAAAGLCAIKGGTTEQIENAAEIALEHHLGMTCDPVKGLVQVPCIERNGFGAIKAYTAASLALKGSGTHFMSLDSCIEAMRETGKEMSHKYKETALGGLAQSWTEC